MNVRRGREELGRAIATTITRATSIRGGLVGSHDWRLGSQLRKFAQFPGGVYADSSP
jgi:hypothetical protein